MENDFDEIVFNVELIRGKKNMVQYCLIEMEKGYEQRPVQEFN